MRPCKSALTVTGLRLRPFGSATRQARNESMTISTCGWSTSIGWSRAPAVCTVSPSRTNGRLPFLLASRRTGRQRNANDAAIACDGAPYRRASCQPAEYEALVTRVEALEARAPRRAGCLGARGAAGDCGGHRWASVMSDRSPDIGDVLRELRVIRKLLEPRVRPVTLSKTDRMTLERRLPAIAAVFSDGELFTSRELVTHPAQGLRVLRGGLSAKQVGRLPRARIGSRSADSGSSATAERDQRGTVACGTERTRLDRRPNGCA